MGDLLFSEKHEWLNVEGDLVTVGITDFAQQSLGDVVFVELPEVGQVLACDEEAGVVESVKAASDVYSPVSGEVVEINEALEDTPSLVNEDPQGQGWFFKIRLSDSGELEGLMSEEAYNEFAAQED